MMATWSMLAAIAIPHAQDVLVSCFWWLLLGLLIAGALLCVLGWVALKLGALVSDETEYRQRQIDWVENSSWDDWTENARKARLRLRIRDSVLLLVWVISWVRA